MSKTCFTIAEQKTNVINFIKKHKDILRMDGSKDITAEFIGELVKSNNAKFFRLASDIRLKFGQNFYIFTAICSEDIRHNMRRTIGIWLPTVFSKVASDKAIKEFCDSLSFEDAIEDCHCLWFNMTPKRWESFEAIFDFYDKQKTPAKTPAKKTVKKTVKKAKTVFTISEQKQKVINFIKKHKNMLGVPESGMNITDEYLSKLKNASTEEFFRLANQVKLKSCPNFFIFYHDEKHHMSEIWLPDVLSKNASDKAINEFCGSNRFEYAIGMHCSWYNMTPKRWETFEAIFDFYDKSKTPAKKTAKKAKKTVKPEEVKLSDSASLKDDIVFIDFEADEFNHLMMQCNSNIDVFIDSKSECNAKNQIDHLINAFKLAKKEADTFIELLENAKKQGAKHVVDSNYAKPTEFNFTK